MLGSGQPGSVGGMRRSNGPDDRPLVLLTGASGYIGGRLLKELEKAGWPVRCLAGALIFLDRELLLLRKLSKQIAWIAVH